MSVLNDIPSLFFKNVFFYNDISELLIEYISHISLDFPGQVS